MIGSAKSTQTLQKKMTNLEEYQAASDDEDVKIKNAQLAEIRNGAVEMSDIPVNIGLQ